MEAVTDPSQAEQDEFDGVLVEDEIFCSGSRRTCRQFMKYLDMFTYIAQQSLIAPSVFSSSSTYLTRLNQLRAVLAVTSSIVV